jgi:AraC-like DNA-binding protein
MAEQLEMVVSGRRRPAMPNEPHSTSGTAWSGFFLESHQVCNFDFELPDHWVPYYMVGFQSVRRGARHFFEGGRQHVDRIQYGDCFVLGPREFRGFRMEGEGSVCMVAIDPLVLREITADSSRRNLLDLVRVWNGADVVLGNLIQCLERDAAAGSPGGRLRGEHLCTRIAEELVQRYSIGRTRPDGYKGGLSGARFRLVREYIDEYLSEDLDSGNIAAVAGLSKYHFGKAFKETTGMTLHGYVLGQRMWRAQALLTRSNVPLAEVAEAAGFSSQSHLTTLFARRLGLTPRAYREETRRASVRIGSCRYLSQGGFSIALAARSKIENRSILKDRQLRNR